MGNGTIVGTERYPRINLALISIGALLSSLAVSSITISLLFVAEDLHTSTGMASAIIIVYLLVLSGLLLFFGKLGDVWSYRKVFLAGIVVFSLGSLLCGLSEYLNQLILFRGLQALGAAMVSSIGPAWITRHVSREQQGTGFAYVSAAAVLGVILGPTIGISITDLFAWRWIFFFNVPVCVAIFAIGWFTLPKRTGSPERRFDLIGATIFSCASVALVLAISSVHAFGLTSLVTGSLILFTVAFWSLALIYESSSEDPAFDISLFRNWHFTNANISFFLLKMVFNGPVFLFPFYLHLVLGYSYELTSLIIILPGAVMLLTCPGVGVLTDRFGARSLCVLGALGAAAVYLVFAALPANITLVPAIVLLISLGLARGIFLVPNTKLIMDHSPTDMKGAASGIMKALGNTGIILGIVIFQIAFSETLLVGEAALQYNHDPFTVPMPHIVAGFQVAFLLAAALSLAAVFFAWHARDLLEESPEEEIPADG